MKNRWRIKFSVFSHRHDALNTDNRHWGIDGNLWIDAPTETMFSEIESTATKILKEKFGDDAKIWQILRDGAAEYFAQFAKEFT